MLFIEGVSGHHALQEEKTSCDGNAYIIAIITPISNPVPNLAVWGCEFLFAEYDTV